MRLQGRDFTEWGAGLSVDLRQGAAPYDASLQRGLSFWSRGDTTLRVIFIQQNLSTGYACSDCSAEDCNQYYYADVPLTDTWTEHRLPWAGLVQSPAGVTPFDPVTLALASVAIVGICALSSLIPAVKAGRVDPVRSLRVD